MQYIKNSIFYFLASLIFISGCINEKKKDTFRTEAYFDKHEQERNTRIKECEQLKDVTIETMRDCDNARTSKNKIFTPLDTSNMEL